MGCGHETVGCILGLYRVTLFVFKGLAHSLRVVELDPVGGRPHPGWSIPSWSSLLTALGERLAKGPKVQEIPPMCLP